MSKRDLYDDSQQPIQNPGKAPSENMSDPFADLFASVDPSEFEFEEDADAYYNGPHHLPTEQESIEPDDSDNSAPSADPPPASGAASQPNFNLGDYTDYDSYSDSGTYRSYNGSSEYRSFDAAMPDAPEEGWYHYSDEDSALEDRDDEEYDDDDYDDEDDEDYEYYDVPSGSNRALKIVSHILLVFITLLAGFYLMVLYAPIPALTNLRDTYIRTAMSTLNHKWLATAIIPSEIIDQVMLEDFAADDAMVGVRSDWGDVTVNKVPTFNDTQTSDQETTDQTDTETTTENTQTERTYSSPEEQTFFEMFYELDYDSMQSYLSAHPDVLSYGWGYIDINEAGLSDSGTDIMTTQGDQVLALDAQNGILLLRVHFGSSRGVMAILKDTSRLSLCAASTLPVTGQTAGKICDDNNGLLAITGSAFLDDGTSNGGQVSGLAICNGVEMGTRLGQPGDKRLELRDDGKMYIVDSTAAVGEGTRDACEFHPALVVDGVDLSAQSTWTGPQPRAVLGQSDRLETMMVIVEGRLADSPGCSVVDVAAKMVDYGCVQALNLDGGTSAIMYYKGEYVTRCSNTALPGGRTLPSAWVYK